MTNEVTPRSLLSRINDLIGTHLEQTEVIFAEELQSWHPYVTDVVGHVARFRGKRLRPMLVLLTADACGGIRTDHHVLSAVVEMIHTATLVHDDVLDDASTRRHVATVNSRWNNETSVLCGDFLFTHAFHLAASLESTLACRLIGRATNLVCEGELAQIHERGNLDLGEAAYFRIIEGKTAELCALCSYLGAHFAGAEPAVSESMREYGRCLGIAFQIADDILDIVGSEDTTGKSLGSDYAKQKLTLPVIRLLGQADPGQQREIRDLLAQPTTESWQRLAALIVESGSLESARQSAAEYIEKACQCLDGLEASPARKILEELTEFAGDRAY